MQPSSIRIFRENEEHVLESEQWVNRPVAELFAFFSVETNLELLTPEILSFRILRKSTPEIGEGTLIDYRLKIHGFPAKWRTRIESWEPPFRFVDTQLSGPYAFWHHTHIFEALDGGTLMRDRVRFKLPFGRFGDWVASAFVRRDVRKIFEFRRAKVDLLFGGDIR